MSLLDAARSAALSREMIAPFVFPAMVSSGHPADEAAYVIWPEELELLTGLYALARARRAVETGSFTGSSAGALQLVSDDVWSIDNGAFARDGGAFRSFYGPESVSPGFRLPEAIRHRVHFVWGNGPLKIPYVVHRAAPTLFFHDSDHGYDNTRAELEAACDAGAVALAAHDTSIPSCLAAWEDVIAARGITGAVNVETPLGIAICLVEDTT